ncbi:MAG: N-acetyltransferase [Hyphomonas sp.]|uniref:GNAT family N-acetyltransferase n=1 Tax=Hyphomonas sp. TaxID=87 RepID=UPI00179DECF7|nr:N-acetyltransferase [Hyphomonas sp.]MBA3068308.1 N-acetyltransferase [Hyphomonas sp.]MBU3922372.1 N-acetyltransferase [Alphaproteobacteria bacterium]MBU4060826.1 N-acetyltransferase [Alphaproteobacteria bacterium]MBU4164810.1 N-acetyltransferase [Alphaproteobacteria bacterium]
MIDFWTRTATPEDMDAIAALNEAAFGGPDEARVTRQLQADGDSLISLVAENESGLVGHIEFFRILIDGEPAGAGLGPLSAKPCLQKSGIGSYLVRTGLEELDMLGETIVFVLGHDTYYPRFGFAAETAQSFAAPWSGPHFMAIRLAPGGPTSGTLTYPRAFS